MAERDGGAVINADALQVYADWRVLTARPSAEEEARAPHMLYGHVPGEVAYSTGRWLREVRQALADCTARGLRPIIVGGTGLNFTSLTSGLVDIPETPPEVRARADALGPEALRADLAARDPATLAAIDAANPMRVQRAWEVLEATGRPLIDWQAETPPPLLPLSATVPLVLRPDIPWLNARIAARFDQMLAEGALEEARAALPGWDPARPSAKALGAPELIAHLRGELTLDDARDRAVTLTRQYAKRQRTWFRNRMKDWRVLDIGPETRLSDLLAAV
ncbi:tRNA (adenosine(37)-N6)-dimethylallyltransferase MiaA [Pontivivens ytuae]|nr:tRNA (adenosine(37)-N6)-dimethylallyltransferase MiaA [Pontivivens ytuae]